jgi:hypothetical protein
MKIKSYLALTSLFLLGTMPMAYGMEDNFNFISDNQNSVKRKSTFIVPQKKLSNGKNWEKDVFLQQGPTCCSHAVSECLKYVHGRDRILPYYLHKTAHLNYGIVEIVEQGGACSKMKCNSVECLLKTQTKNGVTDGKLSSISFMGKRTNQHAKAIEGLNGEDSLNFGSFKIDHFART